jgi:protein-L-isoaspartate O-methyltransferase
MGLQVAENMHLTNFSMTAAAVKALELNTGEDVLEIGHGNAAHLEFVLNQSDEIRYSGLEIPQTMHEEAKRLNEKLAKKYDFHLLKYR